MTMTNKSYRLVPMEDEPDQWAVIIAEGPYDGVVYKYGTVSVDESQKEAPVLDFWYEVIDNPDEVDTEGDDFKNYIGDILVDIVMTKIQQGEDEQTDGDGSSSTV